MDPVLSGRKCTLCKKGLKLIGLQRLNGKLHQCDWTTRDYHKKCYKIIRLREEMKLELEI
jgi:hypothetical protein